MTQAHSPRPAPALAADERTFTLPQGEIPDDPQGEEIGDPPPHPEDEINEDDSPPEPPLKAGADSDQEPSLADSDELGAGKSVEDAELASDELVNSGRDREPGPIEK